MPNVPWSSAYRCFKPTGPARSCDFQPMFWQFVPQHIAVRMSALGHSGRARADCWRRRTDVWRKGTRPAPRPGFSEALNNTRSNKKPPSFRRGLIGHNKIRSGDLLLLPAPAEQTQRAETGGEEYPGVRFLASRRLHIGTWPITTNNVVIITIVNIAMKAPMAGFIPLSHRREIVVGMRNNFRTVTNLMSRFQFGSGHCGVKFMCALSHTLRIKIK